MALMFVLFFLSLAAYAGVAFRAANDAAKMALLFATVACATELGYRAVEMGAVPQWAEAYRQAEDTLVRATLRSRVETFQDVTTALYSVIRGAAILDERLLRRGPPSRAGLAAHGRAPLHGQRRANRAQLPATLFPFLAPVLDWVFILVLAPLYVCIGVWLWTPKR